MIARVDPPFEEVGDDDDAIFAAYVFHPAFAIKLGDDTILVHFCTNNEGLNDMTEADIARILRQQLEGEL